MREGAEKCEEELKKILIGKFELAFKEQDLMKEKKGAMERFVVVMKKIIELE